MDRQSLLKATDLSDELKSRSRVLKRTSSSNQNTIRFRSENQKKITKVHT